MPARNPRGGGGGGSGGGGGGGISRSQAIQLIIANATRFTIGAGLPSTPQTGDVRLITATDTNVSFFDSGGSAVTARAGDFVVRTTQWTLAFRTGSLVAAMGGAGLTADNFGTAFPTTPAPTAGQIFIFIDDVASGVQWKNSISDAATAIQTSAKRGQVFEYQAASGSNPAFWILIGTVDSTTDPIVPFEPVELGQWTKNASAIFGSTTGVYHIQTRSGFVRLTIENNGLRSQLDEIEVDHGISITNDTSGTQTLLTVTSIDKSDTRWVEIVGRWNVGTRDGTAVAGTATIGHIPHDINLTKFVQMATGSGDSLTPFAPVLIADYSRTASTTPTDGNYFADATRVIIADDDNREILESIAVDQGIVTQEDAVDTKTTFIVEEVNIDNSAYVVYTGRWVDGIVDTIAADADVSVSRIPHDINMTPYVDRGDLGVNGWSFGLSFPENPYEGQYHVFSGSPTDNPTWVDITGTAQGPAFANDVAQYLIFNNTPQWVYQGRLLNTNAGVSIHQLWVQSKTTETARYNSNEVVDTDWTTTDNAPSEVEVDGDTIYFPTSYRGQVSAELWRGDTLIDRLLLELESNAASENILSTAQGGRFFWHLTYTTRNSENVYAISVRSSENGQGLLAGFQFRVYAEVAVPRGDLETQVDGLVRQVSSVREQLQNVPVSEHVLWVNSTAQSGVRVTSAQTINTNWSLSGDEPDGSGIRQSDDHFYFPRTFRGSLFLEVWRGETLVDRKVQEIETESSDISVDITDVSINRYTLSWIISDETVDGVDVHDIRVSIRGTGTTNVPSGLQFRIYAEQAIPARAIARRIDKNEADIETLETRVANIPVSAEVLWATSGTLPATGNSGVVDANWVLADTAPTGVAVDGDLIDIPEDFRGDIHVDLVDSTGELIQRGVLDIKPNDIAFSDPINQNIRIVISHDATDSDVLNLAIRARGSNRPIPAGTVARVYGVTALPRATVAGVTQAEFDALKAVVDSKLNAEDFYIDPNRRYATIADLSENWVFVFSHVPAKYSEATHIRVSWDGVIAYNNVWDPTTEYILFSINPTQIPNLADNARTTPSKLIWRVQFSILKNNTELLGIETVPIVINRG